MNSDVSPFDFEGAAIARVRGQFECVMHLPGAVVGLPGADLSRLTEVALSVVRVALARGFISDEDFPVIAKEMAVHEEMPFFVTTALCSGPKPVLRLVLVSWRGRVFPDWLSCFFFSHHRLFGRFVFVRWELVVGCTLMAGSGDQIPPSLSANRAAS